MVMASFARNAAACLKKFHKDIEARARQIGTGIAGLSMLQQQVGNYESILKDLSTLVKDTINTNQKEINREFVPVIEQAMAAAYEACVEERGKPRCSHPNGHRLIRTGTGSFARMKAAMNSHVAQERHTMFQSSAENVKSRLSIMLKELEAFMNDKADEVYLAMRRDYNSVLGGGEVPQNGEILPKAQRLVRKEMMQIIDGVEKVFSKIAGLEFKNEEDDDDNKKVAHSSDDEDGSPAIGKKYEDEDPQIKGEANPSSQAGDREQSFRRTSDESMLDGNSGVESETKLSTEAEERLEDGVCAKVDSSESSGSESSAGSESD